MRLPKVCLCRPRFGQLGASCKSLRSLQALSPLRSHRCSSCWSEQRFWQHLAATATLACFGSCRLCSRLAPSRPDLLPGLFLGLSGGWAQGLRT